ncbi:MAG: CBS domain-containing protein, partial [Nodosilinea sp.]
YDHHSATAAGLEKQGYIVEAVGAATTLVVEALQQSNIELTVAEATVMALGIHTDTGSLLYETATARDAAALAWLMNHGASLSVVADFVEPGLSPALQDLLTTALAALQVEAVEGHRFAWVLLETDCYLPGLSGLAEQLMSLANADVLLFGACYQKNSSPEKTDQTLRAAGQTSLPAPLGVRPSPSGDLPNQADEQEVEKQTPQKLTLIGRAQGHLGEHLNWGALLGALGGGGHPAAAAAAVTTTDPEEVVQRLLEQARSRVPPQPIARYLMSSPVRTIRPDTTIRSAQRTLLRYGHSGLSVVDEDDRLVGIISRRDLDLALHHGFSHAPVKGYMATNLKTITPETPLADIKHLMVTYDIGRLPVLRQGDLVGVVTRTDLLRHLHQAAPAPTELVLSSRPAATDLRNVLENGLSSVLQDVLRQIAAAAQERGWHLYLVGGAVRDLLLSSDRAPGALPDLDLVVDGCANTVQAGAGVELAAAIEQQFSEVNVQVHGRFQTASLVWHKDLDHSLAGLMIDIATARTEFYPYPAANPEVEASSIQQDLYRRDFTVNALALRLTPPGVGHLLDYFGGLVDLRQGVIRVLHANSFIEDPTRIYRAVRFAVRLGFSLDAQTEGYIHHAVASGIYTQLQRQVKQAPALQTRLKNELKYILEAPYWQATLALLDQLQALRCLHSDLAMSPALWQQLRLLSRWIQRYDWPEVGPPWLLRLEGLLAAVPAEERSALGLNLNLPARTLERLNHLDDQEHHWQTLAASGSAPSVLYAAFSQADTATLLLASARHPRTLGPAIWCHLMQWAITPA